MCSFSHSYGGRSLKSRCYQTHVPFRAFPCPFQLLVVLGVPWLEAALLEALRLRPYMVYFPVCLRLKSLSFSYKLSVEIKANHMRTSKGSSELAGTRESATITCVLAENQRQASREVGKFSSGKKGNVHIVGKTSPDWRLLTWGSCRLANPM